MNNSSCYLKGKVTRKESHPAEIYKCKKLNINRPFALNKTTHTKYSYAEELASPRNEFAISSIFAN